MSACMVASRQFGQNIRGYRIHVDVIPSEILFSPVWIECVGLMHTIDRCNMLPMLLLAKTQ